MASNPVANGAAMGGTHPSAEMTPGSGALFQNLAMRPQNPSIAVAHSLGISPAIAANPVARMPSDAVELMISNMSLNAEKAQDLALAAVAAENIRETQFLTAASVVRLDEDLRTVHTKTVQAVDSIHDSDGWMRAVRCKLEKDIGEVKIMLDAVVEVLMSHLDDAAKAKIAEAKENCKAMRKKKDREYMFGVKRKGENEEDDYDDHE